MRLTKLYGKFRRIILLLISVQFFSLAINPGESSVPLSKKLHTVKAEHSRALTLSVFFEEKSEKEKESENEDDGREKMMGSFALMNLSGGFTVHASRVCLVTNKPSSVGNLFSSHPLLFKLHHLYLI
jgi:hypothetical protein